MVLAHGLGSFGPRLAGPIALRPVVRITADKRSEKKNVSSSCGGQKAGGWKGHGGGTSCRALLWATCHLHVASSKVREDNTGQCDRDYAVPLRVTAAK